MDELPSTEFRKRYARLTKPALVTVNGHVIGRWMPATAEELAQPDPSLPAPRMTQAERDAVLRKVNRGGR